MCPSFPGDATVRIKFIRHFTSSVAINRQRDEDYNYKAVNWTTLDCLVNYGNAVYINRSSTNTCKLQPILSAAARVIEAIAKFGHNYLFFYQKGYTIIGHPFASESNSMTVPLFVRRSRVVTFAAIRLRGPGFKPRPGQKF